MAAPECRRLLTPLLFLLLVPAACSAEKAQKEACYSGLTGDFDYLTCGQFCKESKAKNHCRFCKCQICAFCPAGGAGLKVTSPTPATKSAAASEAGVAQRKSMRFAGNASPAEPTAVLHAAIAVADAPSSAAAAVGAGPRAPEAAQQPAHKGWTPWPTLLLLFGICCAAALVYMRMMQDAEDDRKPQLSFNDLHLAAHSQGRRLIDEAIQDVERLEASQSGSK
jgi:hypothetical protein